MKQRYRLQVKNTKELNSLFRSRLKGFRGRILVHCCIMLSLALLFVSCGKKEPNDEPKTAVEQSEETSPSNRLNNTEVKSDSTIKERALRVVKLLENKDFDALSTMVHPIKGLLFSPYSYVDPARDIHFSVSQVHNLGLSDSVYHWGNYDGTGKPIQKTFSGYYEEFVYDADFVNAIIYFNKDIQRGNTINNIREIYSDTAKIVEFYVPGMETKYGGLDWRSLRLVFTPYKNRWYLQGIIHSEWTI